MNARQLIHVLMLMSIAAPSYAENYIGPVLTGNLTAPQAVPCDPESEPCYFYQLADGTTEYYKIQQIPMAPMGQTRSSFGKGFGLYR